MPDPISRTERIDGKLAGLVATVVVRFAEGYERLNAGEHGPRHPALEAQRFALGPAAVSRTARRVTGRRGAADAIADIGMRSRIESPRDDGATERRYVDATAPGAVVCTAIAARAELGRPVTIVAGARRRALGALADLDRASLEPLLDAGEVVLAGDTDDGGEAGANATDPKFSDSAATQSGPARVVVTPYYYARADFERLVWEIALELCEPCPEAERGLMLFLSRGWEQREAFEDWLRAVLESAAPNVASTNVARPARPFEVEVLEAHDALGTLEAAAAQVPEHTEALSVFVYPMWLERAPVRAALATTTDRARLVTINHRPTLAWSLGLGGCLGRVYVDGDQRLRSGVTPRAARRFISYERTPSLGRAVRLALGNWVGI